MKFTFGILLGLLIATICYWVLSLGSESVASPTSAPVKEEGAAVVNEAPVIDRAHAKSTSGSITVASPGRSTLRWKDDLEILSAIQADFNSSFAEGVAQREANMALRKSGDEYLRDAIARSSITAPGLQLREEDFTGITQYQKSELAKLLQDLVYKQKAKEGKISKDFTDEEVAALRETVLAKAIYYPPEFVLDAQGLLQKLDNQDFAYQIRELRVRIYNQAAPHLANLYSTTCFALGAVMRTGVDQTTLGDFEGNAALVTPMVREYQLLLEALSREFVLGCAEIGSRYD